jgi:hypothetical protein
MHRRLPVINAQVKGVTKYEMPCLRTKCLAHRRQKK